MRFFSILIFSISFLIADTYSWEDGGTILGSYGSGGSPPSNVQNVGPTNGITPYDGNYMLTVSEDPIGGTPQAFVAWVTNISAGDQITACFYGYDNTPGGSPSMRIWGSWSDNDDITAYAGSADGNEAYTAGTGWDQVCHTFSTSQENWDEGEALVVQARLYSSSSATEAVQYFIDLVEITTTSTTATIHFPGPQDPVEGPIADAGDDQTVDAGSIVILDGSGSYHTDGEITEYYWEQVSGPAVLLSNEESATPTFTAPNETTTLSFDLSVYDNDGNESTDTVSITVVSSGGVLTIADIQGLGDDSPYVGQYVTTSGYVTSNKSGNGFTIQDSASERSGIWIYDGSGSANIGDAVELTGMVNEFNGLTQIVISSNDYTVISSDNTLFNPIVVTEATEDYESVLVKAAGACDGLPNEYGEWTLNGILIDDYLYGTDWPGFTPVIGDDYTITGIVNEYYDLKILPRDIGDIQDGILSNAESIENFSILEAYPNPFNPSLTIEFSTLNSELIEITIYDIMGHKVENLFSGIVESNKLQTLSWDASNYSSGDYLIHLKSDNQFKTHKITLIK